MLLAFDPEWLLGEMTTTIQFFIYLGIYPCDAEDIEQLGALMCISIEEKEKNGIADVVK